jgi:hypothetical protein
MTQDIRRELISKNLGIKPISHGQVYAFQIAIPDSRKKPTSLERRQVIEQSLLAHQSNLTSLIIRRTDTYLGEDIEYELVYGADWLRIAQELNIEKVWAWVFDMTDEQVITAIAEMELLTEVSAGNTQSTTKVSDEMGSDIASLIDKKLQLATDSIRNSITSVLNGIKIDLDEKLKILNYRIDNLSISDDNSNTLATVLEKLDTIQQLLPPRKSSKIEPVEHPINLLEASDQDIENVLKQVGTQRQQIIAAIEAVHYWKQSKQGLTWKNLDRSVTARKGAPEKIKGFAKGTYERLRVVANIPNTENIK